MSYDHVRFVAQQIQAWLENPLPTSEGKLAVVISVGVGTLHEGEPEIGTMLARANAAMYEKKCAGGRSFLIVA